MDIEGKTAAPPPIFDAIIVGGGAAGCVLAARLSEEAHRQVLLVEAGPDHPPGSEGADLLDPFPISMSNSAYLWKGVHADLGIEHDGNGPRVVPFAQGIGIGGSSNINGMIAYRGVAEEYDAWGDIASGWSWADVLPYFKRLEKDLDFGGEAHGTDGPIPIRRILEPRWAPFSSAMARAARRRGFETVADCNGDSSDGIHAVPMSNHESGRVSAAMAYLTSQVRARANLTIATNMRVERLLVADGEVCGIVAHDGTRQACWTAQETILCAGAVQSPAILLRSGIGPAEELTALGIPILLDRPGVGRGLSNKPKVELAVLLATGRTQSDDQRGIGQNCLRFSSGRAGCLPHDLGIKFVSRTGWHALGRRIGALVVCLYDPISTGVVRLRSANPNDPPTICFGALRNLLDFERLKQALQLALDLVGSDEAHEAIEMVLVPPRGIAARLARRNRPNRLAAALIDRLLAIRPLRRRLLARYRIEHGRLRADDRALAAFLRRHAATGWHISGSARMGPATDPDAVVDSAGMLHGLRGIRIVDASIFPRPVGEGGMQLPVMMAAEKISEQIMRAWTAVALAAA